MLKHKKIFFLLWIFILTACSTASHRSSKYASWMKPSESIKVLCTIDMVEALVRAVGKEHVDVWTLIAPGLDPHSYQLVKGDDETLGRAEVVFYSGLGLEHGPSLNQALKTHRHSIAVGDWIIKRKPNTLILVDGQQDPHIWMDISLWAESIDLIVEQLSLIKPELAPTFKTNAQELRQYLNEQHQQIRAILHQVPSEKRVLITSHDAFNYFTRAYLKNDDELDESWRWRVHAPEGLAPESQLSTSHLQQVLDIIFKYNVKVLFPESNVSKDALLKICSAAFAKGLKVSLSEEPLFGDEMGRFAKQNPPHIAYADMIRYDAVVIANQLTKSE